MKKEEHAIILDFLPYGYPLEKKMMPVAQAIGKENLTLLELIPRRGVKLVPEQEVYIGEGKRDEVYYILGRLKQDKITESAKGVLQKYLEKQITDNEQKFVSFFNDCEAINTRLHQIELLPGFGKKHTNAIILARKEKPFESFEDLKKRVSNLPDPKNAIIKRITEELSGKERYNLFVK